MLKLVQFQLVFAIGFGLILQLVDPHINWEFLRFDLFVLDDGGYLTLMATVAGMGGLFIGLYYTAMSTVSGAIYSRVPNNIRGLLARERGGIVYMRFLAFFTVLSLCLIGFRLIGWPKVAIAVPTIVLFAAVGIVSFVNLGQRAFDFFDPTALSRQLFLDLQEQIATVMVDGPRWDDTSLQSHAHRVGSSLLDTFGTIATMIDKEPHLRGQPFLSLVTQSTKFLTRYSADKQQIASDSRWYQSHFEHKNWYQAEETAVGVARQTATTLQPKTVPDRFWVEDKISEVSLRCIAINLESQRQDLAFNAAKLYEYFLVSLAEQDEIERAFGYLEKMANEILSFPSEAPERPTVSDESIESLGLADLIASLPISILLSYTRNTSTEPRKQIATRLNGVVWTDPRSPYKRGFAPHLLPRIEWLQQRLAYEITVLGRVVSPVWYQTELISQDASEKLAENVKCFFHRVPALYSSWHDLATRSSHPWLAAAILSREWEYWNKAAANVSVLSEAWSDQAENRKIFGLPWAELELETLGPIVEGGRQQLAVKMAKSAVTLNLKPRPKQFQDYPGQFLDATGHAIFEGLIGGDLALVKNIFKPYLWGSFAVFEKNRPVSLSDDSRSIRALEISAAPILDVMDVSGYVRVFAEFYDRIDVWESTEKAWSEFLTKQGNEVEATWFAPLVELTKPQFGIQYRSLLRTQSLMAVKSFFSRVPMRERSSDGYSPTEAVADHASPLVRLFSRDLLHTSSIDGIRVFIEYYVRNLPREEELDFGRMHDMFRDRLQRESEFNDERNNYPGNCNG